MRRTTQLQGTVQRGTTRPIQLRLALRPAGSFAPSLAARLPTQRLYTTEGAKKDVLEWTCAEVVRHLKEHTDPPVSQSLLDGFDMQEINGFALASVRPPTLFRMIKEQVAQGPSADKIEVSDQLLQDTLLGTATYSVQRR